MQKYAKFNGSNSIINAPNLNHTDRSFTRILLFKLEKNNRNIIVGEYYRCSWEVYNNNVLRVWWDDGRLDKFGKKAIPLNEVLRMAMVRDKENDKFLIYINDEIYLDIDGASRDATPSSTPLQFGFDGRSSTAFKGGMSNISIWDRALTPEEISKYSSHKLFGTEEGLECYLDMDHINEDDQIIYDSSPNKNHVTYKNITWVEEGPKLNRLITNIIKDKDINCYDVIKGKIVQTDNIDLYKSNILDNVDSINLKYRQIMDIVSRDVYKNLITGKFIDNINIRKER